ncbi:hypothetical protein OGAPHI_000866 [Ogataea philodendri]|uniref:Fe2OG dioxygenase domain-containing protein n=1 Tax=Ogataea philodendri TaxID=1378263 RepID=A0A9P8PGJ3_9ASCO|nr:uncharacterized protein OGAPHI_000866 [Ogataea philodendri]KAH3671155.1 hypothetical protein OGAPHI_000866 [Ogataea philodendri]
MATSVHQFTSFSGNSRTVISEKARAATFSEIPLISLEAEKQELVRQIRTACTQVGFFYIKDHGIEQKLVDDLMNSAQEFFRLPMEEKNDIHFTKSKQLKGYEGFGDNRTESERKPDLNEQFSWGYDKEMDPDQETVFESDSFLYGENSWPSQVPELRTAVKRYFSQILLLARRLMSLFALALDLPENYFVDMLKHPGAMGRVLHYLPQPVEETNVLGIGAHTDIECCTILYPGEVPALEILNPEGEWIVATPIPGTFVINIGDMLARWSNDFFISTVHRVKNITGQERYSIPVFVGVDYETVIEPLETCISLHGKKYPPVKAGDYVYKRLAYSRFDKQDFENMLDQVGVSK